MRLWRVLALATVSTLSWGVAAQGAVHATPLCKAGQKSTKAKPCVKAAVAANPNLNPDLPPDPGNIAPRHNDTDSVTIFRFLDPSAGKYQIEVQNTSGIGYINSFNWVPPAGMTVTQITSTEGGHCTLSPNPVPGGGTPMISCVGGQKGITPPKCTCEVGGVLSVNFLAKTDQPPTFNGKYWTYYGIVGAYTKITQMTPVPYHIPSVMPSPNQDLPICKKGQSSTSKSPCVSA
jgi:hypothetical protein